MKKIYENVKEKDLFLPNKPSQRFYKFKCLKEGAKIEEKKFYWRTFIFKDKKSLLKKLLKHNPLSVYYSVNRFINPELVDKRKKVYIIKKYTLFDFDYQNIKEVKKLWKLLDKNKIKYIGITSKDSYQIITEELFTKSQIDKLSKKVNFDCSVYDDKRVCRLISTYNIKLINGKETKFFTKFIFHQDCDEETEIPKWVNDKGLTSSKFIREIEKPVSFSPFFYKSVNNKAVKGFYIPYFRYDNYNPKLLRRLQAKWNLGNLYIFDSEKEVFAVSLRMFDIKRLKKIIKDSNCKNMPKSLIRTSEKIMIEEKYKDLWKYKKGISINKDLIMYNNKLIGKVIDTKPQAMCIIKASYQGNVAESERHENLLHHLGFNFNKNDMNLYSIECECRGKIE